jgi:hypothetical protein
MDSDARVDLRDVQSRELPPKARPYRRAGLPAETDSLAKVKRYKRRAFSRRNPGLRAI